MTAIRRLLILLLVAMPFVRATRADAQADQLVDVQYQLKAEALCKLANILVPEAAVIADDKTFRIGIVGKDPFPGRDLNNNPVNFLEQVVAARRTLRSRPIEILRFNSAQDCRPCHVLFISSQAAPDSMEKTAQDRLTAVLKLKNQRSPLLAGDSPGLAENGAAINFFLAKNADGEPVVKFELNTDAAKRAGLAITPGLLRLEVVKPVTDNPLRKD